MTTTELRVCRRCHGSGRDPEGPTYNEDQEAVLAQLSELGAERGPLVAKRAYMRTEGRLRLDEIYARTRTVIAKGDALEIRTLDMQDALGVSGAAFYKIKSGRTG